MSKCEITFNKNFINVLSNRQVLPPASKVEKNGKIKIILQQKSDDFSNELLLKPNVPLICNYKLSDDNNFSREFIGTTTELCELLLGAWCVLAVAEELG